MVTFTKGLKHVGLDLSFGQSAMMAVVAGILLALLGTWMERRVKYDKKENEDYSFTSVERVFGILMMFTACAMAFAHGSNDVANAVGPLAAVVSIIGAGGELAQKSAMPAWILLLGGAGIVLGLVMYGHKVIATVGNNITDMATRSQERGVSGSTVSSMIVMS